MHAPKLDASQVTSVQLVWKYPCDDTKYSRWYGTFLVVWNIPNDMEYSRWYGIFQVVWEIPGGIKHSRWHEAFYHCRLIEELLELPLLRGNSLCEQKLKLPGHKSRRGMSEIAISLLAKPQNLRWIARGKLVVVGCLSMS